MSKTWTSIFAYLTIICTLCFCAQHPTTIRTSVPRNSRKWQQGFSGEIFRK